MNRDTAPGPAEDREESSARPQAREEECAQLRAELAEAQGASWRKDAEERPTSVYDWFGASEPVVSIDHFLDGEGIAQEDLVAWVTVGKEHLPRTEDHRGGYPGRNQEPSGYGPEGVSHSLEASTELGSAVQSFAVHFP